MRFGWAILYLGALSGCSGWAATATAQPSSRPSLTLTPSSPINISGAQVGPFSPSSIQYYLSASTGTIKFAITPPFWLTADPRVGTVGADVKLAPRAYDAPVTFTNLTDGEGTTSKTAKLSVSDLQHLLQHPHGAFSWMGPEGFCGTIREGHSSRVKWLSLLHNRGRCTP
jgi:hypothetical protein